MLFSTFKIMSHRRGIKSHQVIQETLREIELSEQLGFDHVWLTEHHGSDYGLSPSPSVLAAAVAMKTRRLGIGFAVNVTPLHHPIRLAEEIALVDHLSEGRVIAGFGPGYSPFEFSLYGIDFDHRHAMHKEILEIVKRAWTQDRFDYDGAGFQFKDTAISIKPFQKPHPPIVVTANQSESIVEAAQAGHRLLVLGALEAVKSKVETYRSALSQTDHPQTQVDLCLKHVGAQRHVFVSTDPGWNRKTVEAATAWQMRIVRWLRSEGERDQEPDQEEVSRQIKERVAAGSPEEVADQISELQTMGVGEVLCWFKWGEISHDQAVDSMKLFAEHVMPRFW